MENFMIWLIAVIVTLCAIWGFVYGLESYKKIYILEERIEKIEEMIK